jgi:hypothetical protein
MILFAALTLLMTVVSYVFLLALAVSCVALPGLAVSTGHGGVIAIVLLLFGMITAATLLWSIIPRQIQFDPPGPLLERREQPRLFAELDSIAAPLGHATLCRLHPSDW